MVYVNEAQLLWQEAKDYTIDIVDTDHVEIVLSERVISNGVKLLRVEEDKRNSDPITRIYIRSRDNMQLTSIRFRM